MQLEQVWGRKVAVDGAVRGFDGASLGRYAAVGYNTTLLGGL